MRIVMHPPYVVPAQSTKFKEIGWQSSAQKHQWPHKAGRVLTPGVIYSGQNLPRAKRVELSLAFWFLSISTYQLQ